MARRAGPWLLLALALVATSVLRAPLIVNARAHLDSDLAVDGLTLREALGGHWRWHYPGTPHVGTATMAVLVPVGLVMGATPGALAVSGAILWGLVVVATFALALRGFGPRVAAWALVPLAFSTAGLVWLSGRITGGHLLAAAWHAIAFLLLFEAAARGGIARAVGLGLWCGLGTWNDSMGLMTLAGVAASGAYLLVASVPRAARGEPRASRPWRDGAIVVAAVGLGVLAGLAPRLAGRWADPHDPYREQFAAVSTTNELLGHARILFLDALPRLVVGHRLPGFQVEPGGIGPDGMALAGPAIEGVPSVTAVVLGLGCFLVAVPGLAFRAKGEPDPDDARSAVRWGLLATSAAVIAAFVLIRNVANSDNYRYLVLLVVPWAIGFGRLMAGLAGRGTGGMVAAGMVGVALAAASAADDLAWYRRLGWVDEAGRPKVVRVDDPILDRLLAEPGVTAVGGDYWDVYRYAFLSGGRFLAVPSAHYPDRFPEWSPGLAGGHPSHVVARPTRIGADVLKDALRDGGAILSADRRGRMATWPASGR